MGLDYPTPRPLDFIKTLGGGGLRGQQLPGPNNLLYIKGEKAADFGSPRGARSPTTPPLSQGPRSALRLATLHMGGVSVSGGGLLTPVAAAVATGPLGRDK